MVSWTTNVAEIGPAVATLGRPLRLLRIPVDEWAVALALALRAFPMLIDEFQVLYAARRLRPKRIPRSRKARRRRHALELIDLLAAAITVTLRRADEMGDAITARGGTGQLSANPARAKLADWVTLAITVAASGAGCGARNPAARNRSSGGADCRVSRPHPVDEVRQHDDAFAAFDVGARPDALQRRLQVPHVAGEHMQDRVRTCP